MKNHLKPILLAGAMLCFVAGSALAAPDCANAASDPDGDGWGWKTACRARWCSRDFAWRAPC